MSHEVVPSSVMKPGATSNYIDREKANANDVPVAESKTNKGKEAETESMESDSLEKSGPKTNGSKAQLPPHVVEKKSVQAKTKIQTGRPRQTQSGPLMPVIVLSHSISERARNLERLEIENQQVGEKIQPVRKAPIFSGPLNLPNRASANSLSAPIKSSGGFKDSLDNKSKSNVVRIKGRFSVTSENVDLVKGSPIRKSASVGNWTFDSKQMSYSQPPKEIGNSNLPASVLMPHLQNLFQQTAIQQDLIMNLLSSLQTVEVENPPQNGKLPPLPCTSENNGNVELIVCERERMLIMKISELQARMIHLTDELTAEKVKYVQLQQQLSASSPCGEGDF